MEECILEMRDITKTFPGVKALSNVNFKVKKGEIHCLVGENGAGKSTLMKVLSGVYPIGTYSGDIVYRGEVQAFKSIADSENAGIAIIYQELALIPELTLYENIYFGHELMSGKIIDWNKTIIEATKALRKVRLDINPSTKVKALGVGNQQLVEIAKALSKNVELLILDEPTAALNEDDSQNLLDLLRELKGQGVTCIMISHKLKEIISIADTITVLRDGATICSMDTKEQEVTEQEIIKYMVGREIENIYPKRAKKDQGEICFEIKDWTVEDVTKGREILHHISLNVRKGEIVGIQGLMGAGRTELAMSLFGNPSGYKMTSGEILLNGEAKTFKHPKDAIKAGIAYVTEDRKGNGLILIQDIRYNTTLANLEVLTKGNVINANEEINVANQYKDSINIKAPSIEQKVGNLSGGNQQKVSLAKWLFVQPKVLILDEPTRGIDVGAKYEIYTLMNRLVEEGMSIIMISSELPEVLGMSDRLYVMSNGTITGELTAEEATEQKVMAMATTR
ncbi:sugar ABC transporter ATP-binding protein [Cellulosilyticum sp. ST5]|uniref:Monosaccharide-transporting ATPase n=1 Tax=Cellulosilyticum lentocellum (strain ATCC 49066 / DSM 5427 / NCIMB 11756 / RHM5) TaxID=642492 RepID=F2JI42_CELLD|nr:sugar ABC transporter ATP-binding protein [Cellulosilyticum lentocellum]ADZ83070.1 Monosaccharide-transporting ATPase [Cellulosilyticum lentocellum DSM 5427]